MLEWLVPKIDNQLKHWLDEIFKPNGAQYFKKKKNPRMTYSNGIEIQNCCKVYQASSTYSLLIGQRNNH